MNIKPLADKVVIKDMPAEEVTQSGIVIPGTAKEKPQTAEVVAVGPGAVVEGKLIPMTVKVGDEVLFRKFAGSEIKYQDEEYIVLSESDILAIIEK
ncbi:MAG: co-chaperone GroES [Sporomusa sp.]